MSRRLSLLIGAIAIVGLWNTATSASEVDEILAQENKSRGVATEPLAVVDELTFLRRATVDLIARIPTNDEINQYMSWPSGERRMMLIDKLMADERYADRWTVFFGDMLRLRSQVPDQRAGTLLLAWVHQAVKSGMPYDVMCRELIRANGRQGADAEVTFILGDDANPLALAGVTSQVFMGIRMGCAECHDHPFDVWTREDFYGLAAFYGKTRRIETSLFENKVKSIYTTEVDQTSILWPPEGVGEASERKPIPPKFPIELAESDRPSQYIARLQKLRKREAEERARVLAEKRKAASAEVDNLLETAGEVRIGDSLVSAINVGLEAKRDIQGVDLEMGRFRESELRAQLADFVTDPRNRYFGRAFVNRMWAELVGRGFVEPVDDFRDDNVPSHPETLDYLVDEFIASGFNVKSLIQMIVSSDVYQRGHILDVDEQTRMEYEGNFLSTPMRRMLSEALYDSIVTAGHMFDYKHPEGANTKSISVRVAFQVPVEGVEGKESVELASISPGQSEGQMMAMEGMQGRRPLSGYDLEQSIELDFGQVLKADKAAPSLEKMNIVSTEELEAQQMAKEGKSPNTRRYRTLYRMVEQSYDDNPRYNSSLRMASPAPEGHFLRVFGQPSRETLGDLRDRSPSMRQALMILNGKMTHEASRVGPLEVMYKLLVGPKANLDRATRLAYREILTREPSTEEISEAKQIIASAGDPLNGMADLRWVLLNCHEFRFIP